jgi:photosystem II stability/assembly factor-like uncharacterized protein
MKLKLAAVAALGVGSLVGVGIAPATGSASPAAHLSATSHPSVTSSTCHSKPSPAPVAQRRHQLAAVQFVSPTVGWVVGADRVVATTNGGTTWTRQRLVRGADYSEVDAIDADHAWVVGRHQLIGTTNGGASWHKLAEPCPLISSVHFISPSDGYAVAGGKLLRTTNDGATWTAMHAPTHVQSMCFTSTQLGWLGAHGRIYRTSDAGQVWADVAPGPHGHGVKNRPLAEVECAGSQGGWAELIGPGVGMNQQAHIGYYLNDNGSRPIFAEQMFSHPGVKVKANSPGSYSAAFSSIDGSDAVFVDWCPACGVGTAPMVIATDNGQTLDRVGNVHHISEPYGASFASTSEGWVVGGLYHFSSHGVHVTWKIERTTDGGKHWTTQYVE